MKAVNKGFTLIELMIVVAIVAILAAIALPAYQTYTKKAKFTEVIQATAPYKSAVEICIFKLGAGNATGCDLQAHGIPAAPDKANMNYVESLGVTNGEITVTATKDLDDAVYKLTPKVNTDGSVKWSQDCSGAKDLC